MVSSSMLEQSHAVMAVLQLLTRQVDLWECLPLMVSSSTLEQSRAVMAVLQLLTRPVRVFTFDGVLQHVGTEPGCDGRATAVN